MQVMRSLNFCALSIRAATFLFVLITFVIADSLKSNKMVQPRKVFFPLVDRVHYILVNDIRAIFKDPEDLCTHDNYCYFY